MTDVKFWCKLNFSNYASSTILLFICICHQDYEKHEGEQYEDMVQKMKTKVSYYLSASTVDSMAKHVIRD